MNRRQLVEKLSLLLESRSLVGDELGEWLRENGLHTEHLAVWEQEVREAMTKGEQQAREGLKTAKKKIKEQERELSRKEKALAELAAIVTLQKKQNCCFRTSGKISCTRSTESNLRTHRRSGFVRMPSIPRM